MNIRSLFLTIMTATLAIFACAIPKQVVGQTPAVVLAPQEFGIVATKPYPKYKEMTYCGGDTIYFTFEPATQYSPNEYILFYYSDTHGATAHDEASLNDLTVVVDNTISVPTARLIGTERGNNVWDIVVTAAMKEKYNDCLGKIKAR